MRVGNLVKVQTKNNGDIIGVVVEKYFSKRSAIIVRILNKMIIQMYS